MEGKMTDAVQKEIKTLQQDLSDEKKMKIKIVSDMENEEDL